MTAKKFNSILFYLLCAIIIVIVLISVWFLFIKDNNTQKIIHKLEKSAAEVPSEKTGYFKDFGKLRTFTSDSSNIPVIFEPVLAYEKENVPLYEELCLKKNKIQTLMIEYFSNKTKNDINQIGDEVMKNQLLRLINENLDMGQITDLYFDEFMFLD